MPAMRRADRPAAGAWAEAGLLRRRLSGPERQPGERGQHAGADLAKDV
jgi:hypothetical protein